MSAARILIFSALACGIASAQVGGPLLGFVPDGSSIRVMYGLPAAGAIGAALNAGRDFAQAAISPDQSYALVVTADTGEVMTATAGANQALSLAAVAGAGANPDMVAISPSGTAAALWFPSVGHLQAISGLPGSATVRTIDASFLSVSPLAIAMSDDGQWAVGLWSAGVYAFGPQNQVIPLQTDPGVEAVGFFHNNHNLAVATAARATEIAAIDGAIETSVLDDYSSQPLSPIAIGVSSDNQRVVVADSAGHIIDIFSGSATTVNCGCAPTGLYGLGGTVFRLNGTGGSGRGGPHTELKLFDAASGAVLIVPPALSLAGGRQ